MRTAIVIVATALLSIGVASAAESAGEETRSVAIPAEDLGAALQAFEKQTGRHVVYRSELILNLKSGGATGNLTLDEALTTVLTGTGLTYRHLDASTVSIVALPPDAASSAASATRFQIAAGDLAAALKAFADQGHAKVDYSDKLVRGKSTPGLSGSYTLADGLKALLTGSGLTAEAVNAAQFTIKASAKPRARPAPTAAAGADVGPNAPALDKVLITGDRIKPFSDANVDQPRTIDDPQAYYIFDSQAIEQSGAIDLSDFFRNHVPTNVQKGLNRDQVTPSNSPSQTLASNGSQIDLNGLGTNQTLILVNGRPLPGISLAGANGSLAQPDINGLPLAAVDRIEILPASASAIYGGSAVGGVVNIILRNDYKGLEAKVLYQNTYRGSAPAKDFSLIGGVALEGGKTHVNASLSYSTQEPLRIDDRLNLFVGYRDRALANDPTINPFSQFNPPLGTTPNIAGQPSCNANGCTNGALFGPGTATIAHVPVGYAGGGGLAPFLPTAGSYNVTPPNSTQANGGAFGLFAPLGASTQVKAFTLNITRQFTDKLQVFAELFDTRNQSGASTNPGFVNVTVAATAPSNPFGTPVQVVAATPSNLQGPVNLSIQDQAVLGFKLTLRDWVMEGDLTYGSATSEYHGDSFDQLGGFTNDINSGKIDIFKDLFAYPVDLNPYTGHLQGNTKSTTLSPALRTSGTLWQLPAGPLTLAATAQFQRDQSGNGVTRQTFNSDVTADGTFISAKRRDDHSDAYTELNIPLLSARNGIPFVRALDLQLAGRIDRYTPDTRFFKPVTVSPGLQEEEAIGGSSTSYTSTNETFGISWRPVDSLLLRGSISTAFLPPSFLQLQEPVPLFTGFFPGGWIPDFVMDPKRGNEFVQVEGKQGGNPQLQPERSKNYNLGVVFEPQYVPGLRLALDYARIVKHNNIALLPAQQIVDNEAAFPNRVQRGPVQPGDPYGVGPIILVDETYLNLTQSINVNYNFQLNYNFDNALGRFSILSNVSVLQHQQQQFTPNTPVQEFVGSGANFVSAPAKFQGTLGGTWKKGAWSAGWSTRLYGSYRQADYLDLAQGSKNVDGQLFHDVFFAYETRRALGEAGRWESAFAGLTIQLGAHNVLNSKPAFDASNNLGYFSRYADPRMGVYYFSVKKAL